MRKTTRHVFAVIRLDGDISVAPELRVTIKEIVPTQAIAEAEVARLQKLVRGDYRYFWQLTRWVECDQTRHPATPRNL